MLFSGNASGEESLAALKDRMDSIQVQLDATTVKIERLRTETEELHAAIASAEQRRDELQSERSHLLAAAVIRANELYKSGAGSMFEVLLSSEDFSDLATRSEMLSQISTRDSSVFIRLSRAQAELDGVTDDLVRRESELDSATAELKEQESILQERLRTNATEYEHLRKRLTALQPATPHVSTGAVHVHVSGNMTCPVAGPVSFVDSWHEPRDGHLHEGVDMMADYGTPVVAITSGTISFAEYDSGGGNLLFLDGDDGNSYYYMHNQVNLVTSGHVAAGQQIARVGDTGNAVGTPHLHFEFHPGGGAAIDPYPLVNSLC
ncbi:MAG TPA: peptidoglycan DD-metalloendopeptidase family protein [Actinomycetota bacterium]|nr:peptidoglycan DD-metalloendopeptidase family protein [Actinomycetota bacterium]